MAAGLISLGQAPAGTLRGAFLPEETEALLAVDLGLRTGLALYGREGKLRWYRSTKINRLARVGRISVA